MSGSTGVAQVVAGPIVGAVLLCLTSSIPALAQAGTVERSTAAATSKDQAARQNAKAAKTDPKPSAKSAAVQGAGRPARGGDAWSIGDALPRDSKAIPVEAPPPAKRDFGRLQLDTGSVGLQMESQFKEGQFADGRRVPGLETVKREQPGFVGLSLSVPTNGTTLIPLPSFPVRE